MIFLYSLNFRSESSQQYNKLINVLSSQGFHLAKWISNNHELLKFIPKSYLCRQNINLNLKLNRKERVLGLLWDPKSDKSTFQYNLKP